MRTLLASVAAARSCWRLSVTELPLVACLPRRSWRLHRSCVTKQTMIWLLGLYLVHSAATGIAFGQTARLELGRRLQRFERAWETADPTARATAVAPMKSAVQSFFALNLTAAGKQLDEAWRTVRAEANDSALEQQVTHLQLLVTPNCADTKVEELTIQLTPFYKSQTAVDTNIALNLTLFDVQNAVVATQAVTWAAAESGHEWSIGELPEGDYRLAAELRLGEEVFQLPSSTMTRIADFDKRLQALEESIVDAFGKMDDTVFATVRETANLLRAMQAGMTQETDYPAARRLQLCELLLKAKQEPDDDWLSATISAASHESDVWLSLAQGRKNIPVRLRAPANMDGPMPVIFLFHGAGGSENMFFETYGAGRVVEEARQRGWLVVAPRQGLFGLALEIDAMLNALDRLFDVDRSRVVLLGHSMGAAQVIRQASSHPQIPLAAVALGGGRRATEPETLSRIAWFVAAGEQDFGRSGAQQLHKSLTAAQVPSTYRDYPNVEHMVIVQAAIDDVFQFLDGLMVR